MTTREDVLLQVGEVRFKKGDGTLYLMRERIAWMADHRDTVAASHRFQDIKMQKISPEGKPKIQLQVVLHDGNSSTFHFVNKLGTAAQMKDRDKVKELLQQLLPNFKRKVDKELEEKNRLLTENPALLQLYKDLVITKVITSEEFWESHAKKYTQKDNTQKQEIGVSGAFLADIKPQTDGCNGLKYNLTADIIDCIFKTYPAVKKKHMENVPTKLSESEFWTKFFQSHYFHRDRLTSGTKDIFTECSRIDDKALEQAVSENAGDPLLDLRLFEDSSLAEGFCSASTTEKSAGNDKSNNSTNIVHQNMIKRFNQHSFMVLKTCTDVKTLNSSNATTANSNASSAQTSPEKTTNGANNGNGAHINNNNINKLTNGHNGNNLLDASSHEDEPKNKKARIMEKIIFEDLEADPAEKVTIPQLNLTKVERYLHGPVPSTTGPSSADEDDEQDVDMNTVCSQLARSTEAWMQRTPYKALVSANGAVHALGELSPGGALMRGFQEQSLAQLVPPDVEKELRFLYLSLSELLKHFWNSFPAITPQQEQKAVQMHEALQRFQQAKLQPFEDRAMRELQPLGATLTQHLNQLLQAAKNKFVSWQERKMRQSNR
ncbi:general transcription factor IIH subunit 1 [Culicoides brevitarsis]|uniref:general transcription factor IIH subunit 1 n=1 Tax=Culicoides brevitarsis TaxID=469753 RepID=UPI00307CB33E